MTTRRGFLSGILAAAVAPAIVRASSLMPVVPPKIWTPPQDIVKPQLYTADVYNPWETYPTGDVESIFGTYLYTGKGQTQTIEHSLGWAPQFIMIKRARP
jgi:hypothetical protein